MALREIRRSSQTPLCHPLIAPGLSEKEGWGESVECLHSSNCQGAPWHRGPVTQTQQACLQAAWEWPYMEKEKLHRKEIDLTTWTVLYIEGIGLTLIPLNTNWSWAHEGYLYRRGLWMYCNVANVWFVFYWVIKWRRKQWTSARLVLSVSHGYCIVRSGERGRGCVCLCWDQQACQSSRAKGKWGKRKAGCPNVSQLAQCSRAWEAVKAFTGRVSNKLSWNGVTLTKALYCTVCHKYLALPRWLPK